VHTDAGDVHADHVVVTAPPPMAARIAHEPPLPAARSELERTTFMGNVYKAVAVYERPFWRGAERRGARRPGGEFLVLDGPGSAVFDTTPPGGPGHLCVLMSGPQARELDGLALDDRRRAVLEPLVPHLGPDVLAPVSWHEKAWHRDEFAGGGYLALPEPGTAAGCYPMPSTPVGRVHWAGSETAVDHPGYLDGAIESGERVAAEVLAVLTPAR
jgi:monoamine oxidase